MLLQLGVVQRLPGTEKMTVMCVNKVLSDIIFLSLFSICIFTALLSLTLLNRKKYNNCKEL